MDGEAFANNRKAKLIFFYEWNISLEWEGSLDAGDEAVEGRIEIPNLSEENELEEVDINCTLLKGEGTAAGDALKGLMRAKGVDMIREKLGLYIKELREDFAKDLILPTKDSQGLSSSQSAIKHAGKSQIKENQVKSNGINFSVLKSKDQQELVKETREMKMEQELKCTAEDCFNAFTLPDLVRSFTRGPVTCEPWEGGSFSLFDGNVSGVFTKLVPHRQICQKWRYRTWPEGHFSEVTIEIGQREGVTLVQLIQTGIPSFDYEKTEQGWKIHYFESMKRAFGFGAALY